MTDNDKIICNYHRCGWIGTRKQLLTALNPFLKGEYLEVCPECKGLENTVRLGCYVDNCNEEGDNGTPTTDGYRWHCHAHPPKNPIRVGLPAISIDYK